MFMCPSSGLIIKRFVFSVAHSFPPLRLHSFPSKDAQQILAALHNCYMLYKHTEECACVFVCVQERETAVSEWCYLCFSDHAACSLQAEHFLLCCHGVSMGLVAFCLCASSLALTFSHTICHTHSWRVGMIHRFSVPLFTPKHQHKLHNYNARKQLVIGLCVQLSCCNSSRVNAEENRSLLYSEIFPNHITVDYQMQPMPLSALDIEN